MADVDVPETGESVDELIPLDVLEDGALALDKDRGAGGGLLTVVGVSIGAEIVAKGSC
jgi:hypothetical protein